MKEIIWLGSSLEDLKGFPAEAQREVGRALNVVQQGERPHQAKMLRGFGGGTVLEIVEDFQTDTYRAVYTVRFQEAVYALHCFQKKSKRGGEVPRPDKELIQKRLKLAETLHRQWLATQGR